MFESHNEGKSIDKFYHDMRNAATFMHSQRIHKVLQHVLLLSWWWCSLRCMLLRILACSQELLERYNPLHGLSTEERVKKTANRVGLDMPVGKDED